MNIRKLTIYLLLLVGAMACNKASLTHGFADKGSIRTNRNTATLSVGEKIHLTLSYNSRLTEKKTFTWSSDNAQIASVAVNEDQSGTITALAAGTTTIRVKGDNEDLVSECQIQVTSEKVIKVLAIGNSFSEDALENYLYNLAAAKGRKIIIGNMYIGGASLETHWSNASNNQAAYEYRKIGADGILRRETGKSIADAVVEENWDFISFQEVSQLSGIYDNFEKSLPLLLEYVKGQATNPDIRYLLHQTWAYAKTSSHEGFANYNRDQLIMYNAIVDAVWRAADLVDIDLVVPAGTAIQNGRTSVIGDNFCRDGYHLDLNIGRFTAACTWYEKLLGLNVLENTFKPATLSDYDAEIARHAAHAAILAPKQITVLEDYRNEAPNNHPMDHPLYLDFGLVLSGTPWNNITSAGSGRVTNLLDEAGVNTGINFELTDNFDSDNGSGVVNNTVGLPSAVSSDAFWGAATTNPTGGFTLSRLNRNLAYNFTFFGSRADVSDNRETFYTVKGASTQTVYLNCAGNSSKTVSVTGIQPDADGMILITVGAGPNNNNGSKYYYINSLVVSKAD